MAVAIIITAAIIGVGGGIIYKYLSLTGEIEKLNKAATTKDLDISRLNEKVGALTASKLALEKSLDDQNTELQKRQVNIDERDAEIQKLRDMTTAQRYGADSNITKAYNDTEIHSKLRTIAGIKYEDL